MLHSSRKLFQRHSPGSAFWSAGIFLSIAMLSLCSHAQIPAAGLTTRDGVYNILDFGAVPDGKTDDTSAIQRAIDKASIHGGDVVVPVGRWLCRGHLELKMGVHLVGMNGGPQSWEPQSGSILMPTESKGNEDGPSFIEMRSSTSITGITFYYPEQSVDDIQPYPWTIQIRANPDHEHEVAFDTTISNVTLINSYDGIRTGPTENGRHTIRNVNGTVLHRGIFVDWTGDIGRLENVQFSSHLWANQAFHGDWNKVFSYMQQNLEAFVFGRSDWEYVTNTFVFPAKLGYHFIETPNGSCNGQFSGIGADATQIALQVDAIQPQGLLITNGEFDSHRVGASTQIVISKGAQGSVRFVNSGFWGPVEHNALLQGSGYVSFSSCYFSNDSDTQSPSIEVEGGRVQIENSTFDAVSKDHNAGHAADFHEHRLEPPAIHLARGTVHAIIRGNDGYYGVKILNDIGASAIVSDNEPYSTSPENESRP